MKEDLSKESPLKTSTKELESTTVPDPKAELGPLEQEEEKEFQLNAVNLANVTPRRSARLASKSQVTPTSMAKHKSTAFQATPKSNSKKKEKGDTTSPYRSFVNETPRRKRTVDLETTPRSSKRQNASVSAILGQTPSVSPLRNLLPETESPQVDQNGTPMKNDATKTEVLTPRRSGRLATKQATPSKK